MASAAPTGFGFWFSLLFSRTAVAALARVTGALGSVFASLAAFALSRRAAITAGGFLDSGTAVAALARVTGALGSVFAAIAAFALSRRAALTAGIFGFSSAASFGVRLIPALCFGAAFSWAVLAAFAFLWGTYAFAASLAPRATGAVVPAIAAGAISSVLARLTPNTAWSTLTI